MWWIRLLVFLLTYLTGNISISDFKILSTSEHTSTCNIRHSWLNNKTIHYKVHALRGIADRVKHDNHLRILPFNAIRTIRELRLNIKPASRRKHNRIQMTQHGVKRSNLITIKKNVLCDPNIIIATINSQSIRTKELQIRDIIQDHALDVLLVTETWLSAKDKNWCSVTDLNKHDLCLHTHNRQWGRGSGLGLICKSHFKVKLFKKGDTPSFEFTTWELTIKSQCITITGIYHPQYSAKNRITNGMFNDDFTNFTTNLLSDCINNIILGDFNLHVSNSDDMNAAIFMDTCTALGLYQHIAFPTHKSGNILDLILTEVCSNTTVVRSHRGPFISDHALVIAQLNVK